MGVCYYHSCLLCKCQQCQFYLQSQNYLLLFACCVLAWTITVLCFHDSSRNNTHIIIAPHGSYRRANNWHSVNDDFERYARDANMMEMVRVSSLFHQRCSPYLRVNTIPTRFMHFIRAYRRLHVKPCPGNYWEIVQNFWTTCAEEMTYGIRILHIFMALMCSHYMVIIRHQYNTARINVHAGELPWTRVSTRTTRWTLHAPKKGSLLRHGTPKIPAHICGSENRRTLCTHGSKQTNLVNLLLVIHMEHTAYTLVYVCEKANVIFHTPLSLRSYGTSNWKQQPAS